MWLAGGYEYNVQVWSEEYSSFNDYLFVDLGDQEYNITLEHGGNQESGWVEGLSLIHI